MKINKILLEISRNSNIKNWDIIIDTENNFEAETPLDDGDSIIYTISDYGGDKFLAFATINHGLHRSYEEDHGKSLKIFSEVISITRHYIKKYNPKSIIFTALISEDRERLYDRLAKIIEKEGGYTLEKTIDSDEIIYFLQKT